MDKVKVLLYIMQKSFEEFWVSVSIPFQVFGLSPQLLQPKNAKKANYYLIYNLVIGLVVSAIILATYVNKTDFFDENVNVIIDYFLLYAFLVTHLIVIIESNATTCRQKLIYAKLLRLTDIFHKKFNYKIQLHPLQGRCLKKMWFVSLISFLVIYVAGGTWDDFWTFFGRSVFSIVVTRLRFIQISIYVDILTEYFHSLGIILRALDPNLNTDEKLQKLLIIKDVCGNLIDLNRLIENAFGWSMTAILAQNFVDMLNQCYWTFVNIYLLKSLSFGINIAFFIVSFSIPLQQLVTSCHQCNKQSVKIAALMHTLSSETFCSRQAELIQVISLNMLQQPVQLKIMGVFTVNYDLLAKMVGSMVTYLTIVLQFQLREMEIY